MIADLVSTIIPVYNRAGMLQRAVASVVAQSWPRTEIIIVDDGSTDDTAQAVARMVRESRGVVRALRQGNRGPGAARQAGLELARGEFVQFLDSDDLLLPDKFRLQVCALRCDADAGISYGKTYASRNGVRGASPVKRTGESHRRLFPTLLAGRMWDTSTPLYRREVLDAAGPWSPRRQLEDWEYESRIGAAGVPLTYCDAVVSETVHHLEPHAGNAWMTDPRAMKDRIACYFDVLARAQQVGVARGAPEMQRFVRSLFWMARNAGSYGLPQEAKQLLEAARANAVRPGWDYGLFDLARGILGWKAASRLAEVLHGLVRRRARS